LQDDSRKALYIHLPPARRRAISTMMEVSRGTAYGLGLSQFAVTLAVVLFFPPVEVVVYVPRATNTTKGALAITGLGTSIFMAPPLLGASLLAAVFATVTCKAHEQGLSGQDYQPDVVEQMGMWDLLFWLFALALHATLGLLICDPVDLYGAIASTTFLGYFLFHACAPRGQNVNLTRENVTLLGYCLGIVQVAYQVTHANGATIVMLVVVLDYFLGVGHTYDRQTTIDTAMNCRLFYICAGTLGTALLYATIGDALHSAS
jgi:hypothetical protein